MTMKTTPIPVPTAGRSVQDSRATRLVYLVEDDMFQARTLVSQIGCFGYGVRVFLSLAELRDALGETIPDVILMDISFPEGKMAGTDAIADMRRTLIPDVPVLFISVNDDPLCRLQAVRAGGAAYFTKPMDTGVLIDTLDRLLFQRDPEPGRILIVDDSHVEANVYAMYLTRAGMRASIVTEPMKALASLKEFNPELILMDVYMPDCSGMELARVIRQMEAYIGVPIVFLSSETDRDRQLEAVGLGGDDFLVKPIKPAHLVASVASRVERYRKLRALMLHDGLTGLLNHATTKERLIQEIERARRQNTPLSLAILDLDHFKSVNDGYGHPAGDRVIRSLAQLLTRRLRASDIAGRYGGEEFVGIFPNATPADAVALMEEIRTCFEHIRHRAGDREFSVTFSCGVSSFPAQRSSAALIEAADQALYAAKAGGRNRVVAG